MKLTMIYFDNIQGPSVIFSHPSPIPERQRAFLLGLMDVQEFDRVYEVETRDASKAVFYTYSFEISSGQGRGGVETLMLAAYVDLDLELEVMESFFRKYVDFLKRTPDIYKGLYSPEKKSSETEKDFINRAHEAIYGGFLDLYDRINKRLEKDAYIESLFCAETLTRKNPDPMLFHTLTRAFITAIYAAVPDGAIFLYDIGGTIAKKFEYYFPSQELTHLLADLQNFWRKNHFGQIKDVQISADLVNFRVYDCFECSHMPNVGQTVCRFDEGFLTKLLYLKLDQKFSVKEIQCYATGADFCEFNVKPL